MMSNNGHTTAEPRVEPLVLELAPPFIEHRIPRDGHHLYAREYKGAGPALMLLHGFPDNLHMVFWYVTWGDQQNGMPAWASLPAKQRWQIVTYLESAKTSQAVQEASAPPPDINTSKLKDPPPLPPFTDFRYEKPGTFHNSPPLGEMESTTRRMTKLG